MGLVDRLVNFLSMRRKEVNVLVVGLDNSGKSTLLNHFKSENDSNNRPSGATSSSRSTVPTIGFSVEKFQSNVYIFTQYGSKYLHN
jgi:ADP-ribosylation factor-like protein 6